MSARRRQEGREAYQGEAQARLLQIPADGHEDLADGRAAADAAGGDRSGAGRDRGGGRSGPGSCRGSGRLSPRCVGSIFIQIGTNLANDYSDAKRGADTADRLGPVRVTSAGLVTPQRVLIATWVAFAIAVACGIYLAAVAGIVILLVGAVSIAAGVLYTGGPRPYGYAGLGEVFVFLFFGLVAVNGSYYVQVEQLDALPLGLSISVGFLATAILVVNNVRDLETDRRAGKMTLAVRMGRRERGGALPAAGAGRLRRAADRAGRRGSEPAAADRPRSRCRWRSGRCGRCRTAPTGRR